MAELWFLEVLERLELLDGQWGEVIAHLDLGKNNLDSLENYHDLIV